MSFQFSQNLLADLQPSSQSQSLSLSQSVQTQQSSQPSNAPPQYALDSQAMSQQSVSLLESQSLSQPHFYRSQSSHNIVAQTRPGPFKPQQAQPSRPQRVPASRFTQKPDPVNLNLAKTLKEVQARLDGFPILFSRMLEEGLEYLGIETTKDTNIFKEKVRVLETKLGDAISKSKERNDELDQSLKRSREDLASCKEQIKLMTENKEKYEELIKILQDKVSQQDQEIRRVKAELSDSKTKEGRLRLTDIRKLKKSPDRSSLLATINKTPRLLLPVSTPSSSEGSERKFSLEEIIGDSDEEDDIDIGEKGESIIDLDVFDDIMTVDSDSDIDLMEPEE